MISKRSPRTTFRRVTGRGHGNTKKSKDMGIREYLDDIKERPVNEERVKAIESRYGFALPLPIKHIISAEDVFSSDKEEIRVMSFEEILYAEEELHADFEGEGIIPVADCYSNDFIVYNDREKNWSMYNIVDQDVFFMESRSLLELLDKLEG